MAEAANPDETSPVVFKNVLRENLTVTMDPFPLLLCININVTRSHNTDKCKTAHICIEKYI